jgi:hypothetical protein
MVDDNILRLDVSMHDSDRVSIMQAFEDLIDVILAVSGCKLCN